MKAFVLATLLSSVSFAQELPWQTYPSKNINEVVEYNYLKKDTFSDLVLDECLAKMGREEDQGKIIFQYRLVVKQQVGNVYLGNCHVTSLKLVK